MNWKGIVLKFAFPVTLVGTLSFGFAWDCSRDQLTELTETHTNLVTTHSATLEEVSVLRDILDGLGARSDSLYGANLVLSGTADALNAAMAELGDRISRPMPLEPAYGPALPGTTYSVTLHKVTYVDTIPFFETVLETTQVPMEKEVTPWWIWGVDPRRPGGLE